MSFSRRCDQLMQVTSLRVSNDTTGHTEESRLEVVGRETVTQYINS